MKRVYIYYSSGEEHIFCFWNYFFKSCGIWVSEKTRDEVYNKSSLEAPIIFILGNEDIGLIWRANQGRHAYIVKKNATFNLVKSREDVVINNRGGRKNNNAEVLKLIFSGVEDVNYLQKLLDIFENYQLCGTMWLFHEFAIRDKSNLDRIIKGTVNKVIKRIEEDTLLKDNWHSKFMNLYCRYMECGVKTRNLIERTFLCQELIKKCDILALENGWAPSLCVLSGDIHKLSSAEGKFAIHFYEHAILFENRADILYEMGKSFEIMYGDKARALDYYISAYFVNPFYYRANYKIAFDEEQQGNWKKSLKRYQEMFFWLRDRKKRISVYEILYLYKINRRVLSLSKRYISSQTIIDFYSREMEEFWTLLEKKECFNAVLHCMFKKDQMGEIKYILFKEIEKVIDEFYFVL